MLNKWQILFKYTIDATRECGTFLALSLQRMYSEAPTRIISQIQKPYIYTQYIVRKLIVASPIIFYFTQFQHFSIN